MRSVHHFELVKILAYFIFVDSAQAVLLCKNKRAVQFEDICSLARLSKHKMVFRAICGVRENTFLRCGDFTHLKSDCQGVFANFLQTFFRFIRFYFW